MIAYLKKLIGNAESAAANVVNKVEAGPAALIHRVEAVATSTVEDITSEYHRAIARLEAASKSLVAKVQAKAELIEQLNAEIIEHSAAALKATVVAQNLKALVGEPSKPSFQAPTVATVAQVPQAPIVMPGSNG